MENKQKKKVSGLIGSVSSTTIKIKEVFTLDDLMYSFGYKGTIEKLYQKLLLLYGRSTRKENYGGYREWATKNKVDTRLMPIMKQYGYAGSDCDWLPEKPPSRGDAVFLQLKIRNSYRAAKAKK